MMTKPELIDAVAKRTGMKKKDVDATVNAALDVITETVGRRQEVSLVGFGTFDVRARAARTGRNPRTGQAIRIPERTVSVFRPGRKLREAAGG